LLALISDLASNTTVIFLMQETQIYAYNKKQKYKRNAVHTLTHKAEFVDSWELV